MVAHALAAMLILSFAGPASAQNGAATEEARRHFTRGTQHEQRRELDEAARAYQEAVRLDPRFAVAHDRLGFVYGLQGRTADAIAQFELAREADPDLFDAQYHLGATLWWTGETERALDALDIAVGL